MFHHDTGFSMCRYECVGGAMFDTAVRNVAVGGRIVVIGMISGYEDGTAWSGAAAGGSGSTPWPAILLARSASVRGFFLNHYADKWPTHMMRLWGAVRGGALKPGVDPTRFDGLESIADAIDFMYARKNMGKVVVHISEPTGGASGAAAKL